MKALVYVRNSSASERSVEEQEAECRADCDRRGWTVETVVTDMVGASKHSKGTRHGWARAKKLLPQHDVLVTWESSRAQRDLKDYAELRDLCIASGVQWCYSGRLHDLSTADGQFSTGLDALLAERESAVTRERIERAMRANARKGMPHGRRLYGYQRTYDPTSGVLTGQVPHPTEAPVVRSIFEDYLAGVGSRTISWKLNQEGIVTAKGATWKDSQIRNLLSRPSYCGRRVFRGEVVGVGVWAPIVSEEMFDKVQARLAMSAERHTRGTGTARMLTGVARCSKCGGRTFVGKNKGRRIYHCAQRGCFGVGRDLEKLDRYVSGLIVTRFEEGEPLDIPVDDSHKLEVDMLRTRLDDAVREFTAGNLSAGILARIEADLLPAIAKAEAARRRVGVPLDIDLPADGNYRRWWEDDLTAEQHRAVVGCLITSVTILPAVSGSRNFDPLTVDIAWRVTTSS